MSRYSYKALSGYPDKSYTYLTPYVVIKILLSIFPMLYFISPWLFCNYQFVLSLFTFFIHPPNLSPICQPSKCSLYLWVYFCSSCLFSFLDSIVDRYIFIAISLFIFCSFFFLFKKIFIFLEREEGRDKERERNRMWERNIN